MRKLVLTLTFLCFNSAHAATIVQLVAGKHFLCATSHAEDSLELTFNHTASQAQFDGSDHTGTASVTWSDQDELGIVDSRPLGEIRITREGSQVFANGLECALYR